VLKQLITQLGSDSGLKGSVSLVGLKGDVRPYYAMGDVFVLPCILKARRMFCGGDGGGHPTVATGLGGVPETVVSGKTALVIPAHDPAAMAEAIGRLLNDRELGRARERAREVARTRFSRAILPIHS
jgi:glycosyltransferase involved in cell wall biosynthesis